MNKYEILGIVGEGAYGIVYKAKNKETGEFGKWFNFFLDFMPYNSCSRHQKVQRVSRGRLNCEENNEERSQNAECAQR